MRSILSQLKEELLSWPHVSAHPHRFGGQEFRFDKAEVGHVHFWGALDIPFPRAIRDALLESRLAEVHHWVPDSGWVTFRVRGADNLEHAVWLMRLSYLRYALKTVADPLEFLKHESAQLRLNSTIASLLARHAPANKVYGTPRNPAAALAAGPQQA